MNIKEFVQYIIKDKNMARRLPKNKTVKHNQIINAVRDYYGEGATKKEKIDARQLSLFLMGRRRGVTLTEEQKSDMWAIKQNLAEYKQGS